MIALLSCCLLSPVDCFAHTFGRVIQDTYVIMEQDRLTIRLNIQMDAGILLFKPDENSDGEFSLEEWEKLLAKIEQAITPNINVSIDGRPVELIFEPYGDLQADPKGFEFGANIELVYHIDLKRLQSGRHRFWITDNNFKTTGPMDRLNYFVHADLNAVDMELTGDKWSLALTFSNDKKPTGDKSGINMPVQKKSDSSITGSEMDVLTKFVHKRGLEPGLIVLALVTSLFLGAVHALSPGHGKAMVAAYLIGTKGRIRDAVYLGGVVTITHMASVIVLGILTMFLTQFVATKKIFPWIGVFSGFLIFITGYWLLAQRAMSNLGHTHHGHHHNNLSSAHKSCHNAGAGGILSLGMAGGIVPCPAALVLLLAAVSMQRIVFGLFMIFAFSIGLAGVLILIGILTITASRFTSSFLEGQRWIERLPVISAGAIMLIGIIVAFNALLGAGILRFYM